jgi:hypothetical protein
LIILAVHGGAFCETSPVMYVPSERVEFEVIVLFGSPKLVEHLNGSLELRGGSDADRRRAKK